MAINDLAGGGLVGTMVVEQLFAGEAPKYTDAAPSLAADILKYQLLALLPTGVTPFVVGTHTASQAVIAAQPVAVLGDQVPYYATGPFNDAVIKWPTGAALDSYEKRKAFFNGTGIKIGHITT